jgi:hypothetical protein
MVVLEKITYCSMKIMRVWPMDNKKIIIIGIIIIIIAGIILVMLTSVHYEKIDITPNGTTIEVPANQTKYNGDVQWLQ